MLSYSIRFITVSVEEAKNKKRTQIPISAPDTQILRAVDYFVAPYRRRTVISEGQLGFWCIFGAMALPKVIPEMWTSIEQIE